MQRSLPIRIAAALGVLLSTGVLAWAAPQPRAFPITRAQVVEALRRGGLPADPEQVQLAARVVASVSQPTLRVVSLAAEAAQLQLRLECAGRAECLPFLATIAMPDRTAATAAQQHWSVGSRGEEAEQIHKQTAVHNGSRLTMLLDGDRLHIRMPVICLAAGDPGQAVRVAGVDRKQTYTAEVIDEHTVRGQLP